MFNFQKFYQRLLKRIDYFDNCWEQFPKGFFKYKSETFPILKETIENRDAHGLSCILAVIYNDGADKDYTDILLSLLDEQWHSSEEDIVEILGLIKDPKSVDKLFEVAVNVPDYDDMRALAKKCMWALSAINSEDSIEKLRLLQKSSDQIINENASFQLENVVRF